MDIMDIYNNPSIIQDLKGSPLIFDKLKEVVKLELERTKYAPLKSWIVKEDRNQEKEIVFEYGENRNHITVRNFNKFVWGKYTLQQMTFEEKLKLCVDCAKIFGWKEVEKSLDKDIRKFNNHIDEKYLDINHVKEFDENLNLTV